MLASPDAAIIVHYVLCFVDPVYNIIGALYYINRVHHVVAMLPREVTPWKRIHDRQLRCLIGYTNPTQKDLLPGWVGDPLEWLGLAHFCDAN